MRVWNKARLRWRSLFRREIVEQELESELRFHLDGQFEEYVLSGMSPEDARRAALRAIGGLTQFQEECRDMRRVNWIENLAQDLRFGCARYVTRRYSPPSPYHAGAGDWR